MGKCHSKLAFQSSISNEMKFEWLENLKSCILCLKESIRHIHVEIQRGEIWYNYKKAFCGFNIKRTVLNVLNNQLHNILQLSSWILPPLCFSIPIEIPICNFYIGKDVFRYKILQTIMLKYQQTDKIICSQKL